MTDAEQDQEENDDNETFPDSQLDDGDVEEVDDDVGTFPDSQLADGDDLDDEDAQQAVRSEPKNDSDRGGEGLDSNTKHETGEPIPINPTQQQLHQQQQQQQQQQQREEDDSNTFLGLLISSVDSPNLRTSALINSCNRTDHPTLMMAMELIQESRLPSLTLLWESRPFSFTVSSVETAARLVIVEEEIRARRGCLLGLEQHVASVEVQRVFRGYRERVRKRRSLSAYKITRWLRHVIEVKVARRKTREQRTRQIATCAVIGIQRVWRGYLARQRFELLKVTRKDSPLVEHTDTDLIQAQVRILEQKYAILFLYKFRQSVKKGNRVRRQAALRIQRIYRGMKGRIHYANLRHYRRTISACIKIQAWYRSVKRREKQWSTSLMCGAPRVIQRWYRKMKLRKRTRELESYLQRVFTSASSIQSLWKGYYFRNSVWGLLQKVLRENALVRRERQLRDQMHKLHQMRIGEYIPPKCAMANKTLNHLQILHNKDVVFDKNKWWNTRRLDGVASQTSSLADSDSDPPSPRLVSDVIRMAYAAAADGTDTNKQLNWTNQCNGASSSNGDIFSLGNGDFKNPVINRTVDETNRQWQLPVLSSLHVAHKQAIQMTRSTADCVNVRDWLLSLRVYDRSDLKPLRRSRKKSNALQAIESPPNVISGTPMQVVADDELSVSSSLLDSFFGPRVRKSTISRNQSLTAEILASAKPYRSPAPRRFVPKKRNTEQPASPVPDFPSPSLEMVAVRSSPLSCSESMSPVGCYQTSWGTVLIDPKPQSNVIHGGFSNNSSCNFVCSANLRLHAQPIRQFRSNTLKPLSASRRKEWIA